MENIFHGTPLAPTVTGTSDLLVAAVQAEAGNQDERGIRLVTDVILNRVASSKFPNTVEGVVYAPGQFSVVYNGGLTKAKQNLSNDVKAIVESEMSRENRLNTDILYFNNSDNGGWKYGGHWFK